VTFVIKRESTDFYTNSITRTHVKYVRRAAVRALGKIGDARAVDVLVSVLNDKKDDWLGVCEAAAKALGNIGDARAMDALIMTFSKEPNWYVRQAAAEALGNIGDGRAVAVLVAAFKENVTRARRTDQGLIAAADKETLIAAAKALKNISARHKICILPDGSWKKLPRVN